MTGTAKTEEEEFKNIYGLDIVVIPTNKPIRRIDENDLVYKTRQGKLRAIVEDIKSCHEKGQPVLVDIQDIDIKRNTLKVQILGRGNTGTDNVKIPKYYFTGDFDFANESEWVYSLKRKSNLNRTT